MTQNEIPVNHSILNPETPGWAKMDNFTDDILFNAVQTDDDATGSTHTDADAQNISSPEQVKKEKTKGRRWRGLSALSASANMQDKMLEK